MSLPELDDLFSEWDEPDSPGCALAVVRGGSLACARGYGMASLEHGVANSPSTVFRLDSTSKQFTAAGLWILDREGSLSLDDDVRSWIPELPDYGAPITLRHLVHHTSGLRDYLALKYLAGAPPHEWYTAVDVIELLSRQGELNFATGTDFAYSNSNYVLMAVVMERAGASMRAVCAEHIFGPLGMSSTHVHDDITQIVPERATGYRRGEDGTFAIDETTLPFPGDGGVFTTVLDMAKWALAFDTHPELTAPLLQRGRLQNGTEIGYAFGLMVDTYRGKPCVHHGGAFVGFRSEMIRFPDDDLAVVCLANCAQADAVALARAVADRILVDLEPSADSTDAPVSEPGDPSAAGDLNRFCGQFTSAELGVSWTVRAVAGRLVAYGQGAPDEAFDPIGQVNSFTAAGRTIRFERSPGGFFDTFRLGIGRARGILFRREWRSP